MLVRASHVLDHRILLSNVEYLAFLLCNSKLAANLPGLNGGSASEIKVLE